MKRKPRVLIGISAGSGVGRDYLRGVLSFTEQKRCWDCQFVLVDRFVRHTVDRFLRNTVDHPPPVDGMIVDAAALSEGVHDAFPVVGVGLGGVEGFPRVSLDVDAIARMAAEHLTSLGLGQFHIFAIRPPHPNLEIAKRFMDLVRAKGHSCEWFELPPVDSLPIVPDWIRLQRWVKQLQKPAGVFCVSDVSARNLAIACTDEGVSVPGDLAILGVGNDDLRCRMCKPELSSVDVGGLAVGYEAARRLLRLIKRQRVDVKPVLIPPSRVAVRESTDVMAVTDPNVRLALQYIRENLSNGVNVKQLTWKLGVGRRTLEVAFRKQLRSSIYEEIVRLQLQRAFQSLTEESGTLTEVARSCGIRSLSHFSHFFRRHTGLTPIEYRRQHLRKAF